MFDLKHKTNKNNYNNSFTNKTINNDLINIDTDNNNDNFNNTSNCILIQLENEDIFEKEENEYLEICRIFSNNVSSILIIFENLNYLNENGYHKNYRVEFKIKAGLMIISINDQKYSSDEAMDYFANSFYDLEKSYEKFFLNFPLMTFFHGRQIFTLYESLVLLNPEEMHFTYPEKHDKITEGIYLLDYLLENDVEVTNILKVWFSPMNKKKEEIAFYDVLEYVGKLVKELNKYFNLDDKKFNHKFDNNVKNDEKKNNKQMIIFEDSENNNYSPGLYSVYLNREEFEREIINIYHNFCPGNLPNYKNILICDDSMSLLLIKSFIYRAFYYKCAEPFILINSDELANDMQLEVHSLINTLIQQFNQ